MNHQEARQFLQTSLAIAQANAAAAEEETDEEERRRRAEVLARWRQMAKGSGRNYSQGLLESLPPIAQAQVLGLSPRLAIEEMQARKPSKPLAPMPGRFR